MEILANITVLIMLQYVIKSTYCTPYSIKYQLYLKFKENALMSIQFVILSK